MLDTYKQISDLQHDALVQLEQLISTLETLDDVNYYELMIADDMEFKHLMKNVVSISDLYFLHSSLSRLDELEGLKQLDKGMDKSGY